jgi:hypothetical protein
MVYSSMESLEKLVKIFKKINLWPGGNFSKLRLLLIVFLRVFFLELSLVLLLIFLLRVESIESFSESVFATPTMLVLMFQSTNFAANKEKIQSLYESLKDLMEEDSWIEKQSNGKLKQRIKQVDRIFKISMTFRVLSIVIGIFPVIFAQKLPLNMWFPFDYKSNKFVFCLTAAYQAIGGSFVAPAIVFFDCFPLFLMSYITGILEELAVKLRTISEVKKTVKYQENVPISLKTVESLEQLEKLEELVKCVEIHQKVLEIADKFN